MTNSSFFRVILRFEAAPGIVVPSVAFITRGSIRWTFPLSWDAAQNLYLIILCESTFLDFVVSTDGRGFLTVLILLS